MKLALEIQILAKIQIWPKFAPKFESAPQAIYARLRQLANAPNPAVFCSVSPVCGELILMSKFTILPFTVFSGKVHTEICGKK